MSAFEIAKKAFRAAEPDLFWPVLEPKDRTLKIALSRNARDVSGGYGVQHDPAVFERLEPENRGYRAVYWQIHTMSDRRLVVLNKAFNWQGDWYHALFLPADHSKAAFLRSLIDAPSQAFSNSMDLNRWNPPLVVFDQSRGEIGLIDLGHPARPLHPWNLYESDSQPICTVDFAGGGSVGLDRLPRPVRRIAALLDEALGSEVGGGTLNPVGRVRSIMSKRWANTSNRPWALVSAPYNTRAEVDAGLKAWARVVPARARVLRQIERSYEPAERALADYYVAEFNLAPELAARFAEYAMDVLYRGHFVFSRDGPRLQRQETPWPAELR